MVEPVLYDKSLNEPYTVRTYKEKRRNRAPRQAEALRSILYCLKSEDRSKPIVGHRRTHVLPNAPASLSLKIFVLTKFLSTSQLTVIMADALKSEGNKAFAEKRFEEAMLVEAICCTR